VPVLTIGPHVTPAGSVPVEFKAILFATDFGAAASQSFPYALAIAEDIRRSLFWRTWCTYASGDVGRPLTARRLMRLRNCQVAADDADESRSKLRKLLPANAKLAFEPEYVAGTDFLPEGILEIAETRGIDLIVMGANRTQSRE